MLLEFVNASAVVLLENIRRRSPLDERGAIELGDLERLRAAPRAVCAAALIQWLESVGCTDLRRQHIRGAVDLVQNGQSGHHVVVPGGARVGLEQDSVVVTAANGAHRQAGAAKPYLETSEPSTDPIAAAPPNPSGAQGPARQRSARLVVEVADRAPDRVTLMRDSTRVTAPDVLPDELVAWIDLDAAAPQPTWSLRTPQRGDRVRLLGAPGARKLARILQDARVPRRLRNRWPVLADPAGILWVPGIGVAERVRLHPDTRHAARLVLRSGADAPSTSPPGAAAVRVAPETPAADQARTAPRTPPATPTVVRKPAPREDQRPADWGG